MLAVHQKMSSRCLAIRFGLPDRFAKKSFCVRRLRESNCHSHCRNWSTRWLAERGSGGWRAWRRTWQAVAILIVLLLLTYLVQFLRLVTAHPTISRNYGVEMNAPAR